MVLHFAHLNLKYLDKPVNCPDEIYMEMKKCWQTNKTSRRLFKDLEKSVNKACKYVELLYLNMKISLINSNNNTFEKRLFINTLYKLQN